MTEGPTSDIDTATLAVRPIQAERQVVLARLAIVLLGTLTYPFLPVVLRSHDSLAWTLLVIFWIYGVGAFQLTPYWQPNSRRLSIVVSIVDVLFLTAWIAVTGGIESPYFIAYYLGIAGGAFRFKPRELTIVAAVYGLVYVAMIAAMDQLGAHGLSIFIRVFYMFCAAAITGLLANQNIESARLKAHAEEAASEARRAQEWQRSAREELEKEIDRRTGDLAAANAALRSEVLERERMELALSRAKEEAEQASLSKSAFLAAMSHEIRTPLNAVVGFIELMADAPPGTTERQSYVEVIRRNSEHLGRIVSDILDLSKIEAGRLEIEKISVDLPKILDEVVASLQPEARRKNLWLKVQYEATLPITIIADPMRIKQILLNLVGNALKFTTNGGVTISARRQDKSLLLLVDDTGAGLDEAQRARIFQPFGQAESSTARRFGGTGLGLALSRRLAEALGGDLELIRSVPSKGSSFALRLPLEIPGLESAAIKESQAEVALLKGIRVLIVDDAPDNLQLIRAMLGRAGATTMLAGNGQEALAVAMRELPDAIIMDVQMPIMDGHEATRRLRASGYMKPIIALTAHALEQQRQRSLDAGCTDHLTKPVDRQFLIATICRYLGIGGSGANEGARGDGVRVDGPTFPLA